MNKLSSIPGFLLAGVLLAGCAPREARDYDGQRASAPACAASSCVTISNISVDPVAGTGSLYVSSLQAAINTTTATTVGWTLPAGYKFLSGNGIEFPNTGAKVNPPGPSAPAASGDGAYYSWTFAPVAGFAVWSYNINFQTDGAGLPTKWQCDPTIVNRQIMFPKRFAEFAGVVTCIKK